MRFIRSITSVSAVIVLVTAETNASTTYILARVEDGDCGASVAHGTAVVVAMIPAVAAINLAAEPVGVAALPADGTAP